MRIEVVFISVRQGGWNTGRTRTASAGIIIVNSLQSHQLPALGCFVTGNASEKSESVNILSESRFGDNCIPPPNRSLA